jgi:hypothetical protein
MAGDEYAKLIHETLAEGRTKESLQMRGIQVVTTSGGLVTLLVALSALAGCRSRCSGPPARRTGRSPGRSTGP